MGDLVLTLLVLFAWSFAAATMLPLSSEAPLAVVLRNSGQWMDVRYAERARTA